MNYKILVTLFLLTSLKGFSQENMITFSGGYSFAKIEDTDVKATGWRINALYEFNPNQGKIAHGISVGYISISGTEGIGQTTVKSSINSVPIYYAPKYIFGNEKFKGFVKGALGTQIAGLKREGAVSLSDNDFGFYGGGGAGAILFIKENIFISAEYEIAWASNSWYRDGWINTAMGGIGFKF